MREDKTKFLRQAEKRWPPFAPRTCDRALQYVRRQGSSVSASLGSEKSGLSTYALCGRSRQGYLTALSRAYAAFVALKASANRSKAIRKLAVAAGIKIRRKADLIAILCEIHIGYKGLPDPVNLRSRDAKAIRFLISQCVHPDNVLEYAKNNGGGVHGWARAWSSLRKPKLQLNSLRTSEVAQ